MIAHAPQYCLPLSSPRLHAEEEGTASTERGELVAVAIHDRCVSYPSTPRGELYSSAVLAAERVCVGR